MLELLERFVAFGLVGMLIEVFFTGTHSLLTKNWTLKGQTYLWVLPVYGGAGMVLEALKNGLHWHWLLMAPIYTAVIYFVEFSSGWLLHRLIGRCPWDYGLSRWTPMGLINFRYLPFWFALSCAFEPISSALARVVHLLASV